MLDIKYIRENSEIVKQAAKNKLIDVDIDRLLEVDKKYPEYGFKNHKGYPTKKHLEALKQYGLIDGYRLTYGPVKEMIK